MNRRIRALIEGLLPHSLFGRLFGLLAIAIVSSHLLFGLQVNLREGHNRPPSAGRRPSRCAQAPKRTFLRPICRAPHPKNLCPPGAPAHARVLWPRLLVGPGGPVFIGAFDCPLGQPHAHPAHRATGRGCAGLRREPADAAPGRDRPLEVRLAIGGFNQMQSKLKHQLAERSQFLLAVSHDLRTPLTRMRLRYEQLPAGAVQDKLLQDWQDLSRLVDSTLDYVRGQDPKAHPWW